MDTNGKNNNQKQNSTRLTEPNIYEIKYGHIKVYEINEIQHSDHGRKKFFSKTYKSTYYIFNVEIFNVKYLKLILIFKSIIETEQNVHNKNLIKIEDPQSNSNLNKTDNNV